MSKCHIWRYKLGNCRMLNAGGRIIHRKQNHRRKV